MISAHEKKLPDILGDAYIHHIPAYQRPYAWEQEQAEQLLDDLLEAATDAPEEPYFLGSIVVIKAKNERSTEVVDGQQRLTTLTILCAVLRDTAILKDEIEALSPMVYIQPNTVKKQTEAIRVLTHAQDQAFFRKAIQMPEATVDPAPPKPTRMAQENMLRNAAALRSRVEKLTPDQRGKLVSFLYTQASLVMVETESRASALRIFRVLNDRGMDLSNADIIKADLLDRFTTDPATQNRLALQWATIEDGIGRDEFESLLDALRFRHDPGKKSKTLNESFKERLGKAPAAEVVAFLETELPKGREAFAAILDCDATQFTEAQEAEKARIALYGLSLLPNRDWLGVTVTAWMAGLPQDLLAKTLRRIEALAWSMQLRRLYDSQRVARYSDVAQAVKSQDAKRIKAALTLDATEKAGAFAALDGALYGTFPTNVVRALLERLDQVIAQQPVQWTGAKTVEHILPQNPAKDSWLAFDAAAREASLHRLGNLVLLTRRRNSSASNKGFIEKKDSYFKTKQATYASVLDLDTYKDWTPATFTARHEKLRDALANHWRLT